MRVRLLAVLALVLTTASCAPQADSAAAPIPDVEHRPYAAALAAFNARGFCLMDATLVHSELPEGTVITQNPRPGLVASPGYGVGVSLSAGNEVTRADVVLVDAPRSPNCSRTFVYAENAHTEPGSGALVQDWGTVGD